MVNEPRIAYSCIAIGLAIKVDFAIPHLISARLAPLVGAYASAVGIKSNTYMLFAVPLIVSVNAYPPVVIVLGFLRSKAYSSPKDIAHQQSYYAYHACNYRG